MCSMAEGVHDLEEEEALVSVSKEAAPMCLQRTHPYRIRGMSSGEADVACTDRSNRFHNKQQSRKRDKQCPQ
jgi:hypothetical protein